MRGDLTSSEVPVPRVKRTDESYVDIDDIIKVAKQLAPFIIIYFLGYYEFQLLWPCVILLIMIYTAQRHEEKQRKLQITRYFALGHEKEIILNTIRDLPAWVRFPEIDKAEWLNKIFKQIWQQVNDYAHDLVPKILEPAIQEYVSDFKFNQVVLGNVPLRVDAVKVYDQEDRRKIVMDLDISYAGDCYVTFQTFRFTGGIKDIQLYGRLRVVLTPLVHRIPLIGGVQAYFMNPPHVDFDLIKVTQILDLPVIRSKIKSTTMKVINSMFLYPNAYSINLSQGVNLSRLTVFRTGGILRVHVVEAKNLINKDIFGKSDPYVVLKVGSIRVETPVIENNLNPKWDFWREFEIESNSELKVEVWDKDEGTKDDSLGHARVGIAQVAKTGQVDTWVQLQGVNKGTIHLRLTWLSLSWNYSDLEATIKEIQLLSPYLHTCLLMIYLESSLNLPMLSKTPPNPYVELEVEKVVKKGDVESETCEPLWDKGFTFLIRDLKKAILNIRIRDDDSKNLLGEISFKVDNLQNDPRLEMRRHTFFFNKPYSEASICCSMKLRVLKNEYVVEKGAADDTKPRKMLSKQDSNASTKSKLSQNSILSSGSESFVSDNSDDDNASLGKIKLSLSYSEQRQRLVVQVHEAHLHKSVDSYVKIYLHLDNHKTKKKTKTVKNSSTPVFGEQFEYLISSRDLPFTTLDFQVQIEKGLFDIRRKFLGQTVISLAECGHLNDPFTDWFNLRPRHDETVVYHLVK